MIELVAFDLDGVLSDTSDIHAEAFIMALESLGYQRLTKEQYHSYGTIPSYLRLKRLCLDGIVKEHHLDLLYKVKQEVTKDFIKNLAVDTTLVQNILSIKNKMRNGKVAVCSNANSSFVKQVLESLGIIDMVDMHIGSSSKITPKPEPDMYLYTMKTLNASPKRTLIIEDSPTGLAAAYKSGAYVFRVSGPHELRNKKVIEDILELIAWSGFYD